LNLKEVVSESCHPQILNGYKSKNAIKFNKYTRNAYNSNGIKDSFKYDQDLLVINNTSNKQQESNFYVINFTERLRIGKFRLALYN